MTEEVTLINQKGLTDITYDEASIFFDKHYIAQVIIAIATINAWNRIVMSSKKTI